MTQRPWYPWYPNDYNRDTRDLSLEQDATYRILLDLAWENGGLPVDQTRLRRLLPKKLSDPRRFTRLVLPILERFFTSRDGRFVQSRLEVERKSAGLRADFARTSSKKRWKNNGDDQKGHMLTITTTTNADFPANAGHPVVNESCNTSPLHFGQPLPSSPSPKEAAPPSPAERERDLFRRGKEVLGQNAGGQIAKLVKIKNGSVDLARATIELASSKQDPREYVAKVIIRQEENPRDDWRNVLAHGG